MRTLVLSLVAVLFFPVASLAAKSQWHEKVLYNFCSAQDCPRGSQPLAGLARDANGNLFGTTEIGGKFNDGVVFEFEKHAGSWKYKVLHSFCFDCGDGVFPAASVVVDTSGNIYGVTLGGGPHDCGVVFKLAPASKKYEILHTFCAKTGDADEPVAALSYAGKNLRQLYDGMSPLYGVTDLGGDQDSGAVYELRLNGGKWHEGVLYSFCAQGSDCTDGFRPSGELLVDSIGNLFGNTALGGTSRTGGGVTYKLSHHGKVWREQVLYAFCAKENCDDGSGPNGALVMDAQGTLFGTTEDAGNQESGAIFKLTPNGKSWQESVVQPLCKLPKCKSGYGPTGGLVADSAGNIYGSTQFGGTGNGGIGDGAIFRLRGNRFSILYEFCSHENCTDGGSPRGTLLLDPSSTIFGVTAQGGDSFNDGVIYALTP